MKLNRQIAKEMGLRLSRHVPGKLPHVVGLSKKAKKDKFIVVSMDKKGGAK